ncbi:Endonuclease/exonuclease/phosphatase [Dillenia turbinata]|uniref:DNA-(apurinic or apyrimidinic site) endonuclease n=1 Tax=Dillenia turbinata TaxID=194707 RepID=A0AAN8V0W9_9MAGN
MKIVTYNVNGLRQRVTQFGSLLKLLQSLDADIVCFQEIKVFRQELTADLVMAEGYESFVSCNRNSQRGRGYSGVATFCRVKSAFSSREVALPMAAEEGVTGLLENSSTRKDEVPSIAEGLEEYSREDLLKIDSEGRCIITDHSHFVLFNVYGPRADPDDTERLQFKHTFFEVLQKRWESFLRKGRRVVVVGDLNIAPAAIDHCEPGSEFEKNKFRRWFRSILVESGGPFFDVFRSKHPHRREAFTCWAVHNGAEEFNYGTRIDHILSAGSCLHLEDKVKSHNFFDCHVEECDILTQFKRWKPGNTPRGKAGGRAKLEGSDHAPVFMSLTDISDVKQHSTPPLSARYVRGIHGYQQKLVSLLAKRKVIDQDKTCGVLIAVSNETMTKESCKECEKRSFHDCSVSRFPSDEFVSCLHQRSENAEMLELKFDNAQTQATSGRVQDKLATGQEPKKKARQNQWSQLSLKSFFQKCANPNPSDCPGKTCSENQLCQTSHLESNDSEGTHAKDHELGIGTTSKDQKSQSAHESSANEKNTLALLEWRRIQQFMQDSVPLCKGHKEPCVARVVKKAGPTCGRRFYVCARAEGPSSNPEANCGYFKWAASKSKQR